MLKKVKGGGKARAPTVTAGKGTIDLSNIKFKQEIELSGLHNAAKYSKCLLYSLTFLLFYMWSLLFQADIRLSLFYF